jgi:hypothetical protein
MVSSVALGAGGPVLIFGPELRMAGPLLFLTLQPRQREQIDIDSTVWDALSFLRVLRLHSGKYFKAGHILSRPHC